MRSVVAVRLAPIVMMHLQGRVAFTLFLAGASRRSSSIGDSQLARTEFLPTARLAMPEPEHNLGGPGARNRLGHLANRQVDNPTLAASHLGPLGGRRPPVAWGEGLGPLPKDDEQASEGANKHASKQTSKGTSQWSKITSAFGLPLRPDVGQRMVRGPPIMSLESAACVIPDPDKAGERYVLPPRCGGHDAFFVDDAAGVVGVADGVGGWVTSGIDPGVFSRQLMNFAAESVRAGESDPGAVLQSAHARTTALGSSTAVVMAFVPARGGEPAKLRAVNLGDSGFLLLRDGAVLCQSRPQEKFFNAPFQLRAANTGKAAEMPSDAETYEVKDVRVGDVVVLATDGVLDNLFPEEVAAIVRSVQSGDGLSASAQAPLAERAANRLAQAAADASMDATRISPFTMDAARAGRWHVGGKQDDVAVVVSVVS